MKKAFCTVLVIALTLCVSCDTEENVLPAELATCTDGIQNGDEDGVDCGGTSCTPCINAFVVPDTYTFERGGQSTVRIPGQTERILMGEEIIDAFLDFENLDTNPLLLENMFSNANSPFADASLNASSRQIRNTVASSEDFFEADAPILAASLSVIIRAEFDAYITGQLDEVRVNRDRIAEPGVSGQLADGSSTRFVDGRGLELNQLFTKGLVGGLMLDQIVNNYISPSLLDQGTNRVDNDNALPRNDSGTDTQMEHFWDEGVGYVYGTSQSIAEPNLTIGEDDNFLNRYVGLVDRDPDFAGIADDIFLAFTTGRAAITQSEYDIRDIQTAELRTLLSTVTAVRAVFYLQSGGRELANGNTGGAFHDISEGMGFITSLQFTRTPNGDQPYFTREEVQGFIEQLLNDGPNGLWDVTQETLNAVSEAIAAPFNFTVEQAGDSQN